MAGSSLCLFFLLNLLILYIERKCITDTFCLLYFHRICYVFDHSNSINAVESYERNIASLNWKSKCFLCFPFQSWFFFCQRHCFLSSKYLCFRLLRFVHHIWSSFQILIVQHVLILIIGVFQVKLNSFDIWIVSF